MGIVYRLLSRRLLSIRRIGSIRGIRVIRGSFSQALAEAENPNIR
jgi:hypothetical protein